MSDKSYIHDSMDVLSEWLHDHAKPGNEFAKQRLHTKTVIFARKAKPGKSDLQRYEDTPTYHDDSLVRDTILYLQMHDRLQRRYDE